MEVLNKEKKWGNLTRFPCILKKAKAKIKKTAIEFVLHYEELKSAKKFKKNKPRSK